MLSDLALFAGVDLARVDREFDFPRRRRERLSARRVLRLPACHASAVFFADLPQRLRADRHAEELDQVFASLFERSVGRLSANLLREASAQIAVQSDGVVDVAAFGNLAGTTVAPAMPRQRQASQKGHESTFGDASVFPLLAARTEADRRPFFSAVSMCC